MIMSEKRKNILIFTGDGKGKSTAAFGMAVRAFGHGQRVLIIQFLKQDQSVGELAGLKKLGIEVKQVGRGLSPDRTIRSTRNIGRLPGKVLPLPVKH